MGTVYSGSTWEPNARLSSVGPLTTAVIIGWFGDSWIAIGAAIGVVALYLSTDPIFTVVFAQFGLGTIGSEATLPIIMGEVGLVWLLVTLPRAERRISDYAVVFMSPVIAGVAVWSVLSSGAVPLWLLCLVLGILIATAVYVVHVYLYLQLHSDRNIVEMIGGWS